MSHVHPVATWNLRCLGLLLFLEVAACVGNAPAAPRVREGIVVVEEGGGATGGEARTSDAASSLSRTGAAPAEPSIRPYTRWSAPGGMSASERVAHAYQAREPEVRRVFAAAGMAFPPEQLLFRVFKRELEFEVWAADGEREPLRRVATYEICSASGNAGPKSREHDGQVPEGFYRIDAFNPSSSYHLSMLLNYPNAWDRRRSQAASLGGGIMIHGNCVSIGCLAMTDERIEELWVMAESAKRRGRTVFVNILPARDLEGLIAHEPDAVRAAFWRTLLAGNEFFEITHRAPRPGNRGGEYVF